MEHFKVVLLILVIFAVFIFLNNSEYFTNLNEPFIIEGVDATTPETQPVDPEESNTDLTPIEEYARGECQTMVDGEWRRVEGASLNRDECLGNTGFRLEWLSRSMKEEALDGIEIRPVGTVWDNIKEGELAVKKNNV